MSNLYPKYKQALLGAGVDLVAGTVRALLVDTGQYTPAATDEFLSAIPAAARIKSAVLTNKTVVNGVFDADNTTITSVPTGTGTDAAIEAVVIYLDTGTVGTSRLVAFLDSAAGLPLTPDGGNVVITWHASGIFDL